MNTQTAVLSARSSPARSALHARYELRFQSLFNEGRGHAFPCDAASRVDLDSLSDTARNNYLFARTVVGCDLSVPFVRSPKPCSDFVACIHRQRCGPRARNQWARLGCTAGQAYSRPTEVRA
jgi:hypothetical protein